MKSILDIAKRVIQIEGETLQDLAKRLDSSFSSAVEMIHDSKGRCVITGIGKSAIIGKKIAATLSSTGTPALFMHAADAIHGDLGMIDKSDILICLSKSGTTEEIKVLIPILKGFGNKIIGISAVEQSDLALGADIFLHTPVSREADPNNLAPTASSTAMMVLGDALAMALQVRNGFTKDQFAMVHPGGSLGKRLYLRVSDLYVKNEKPTSKPDDDLATVILEMTTKRLGATAVVDENEKVLGIITDGDLRRMLSNSDNISGMKATDIMSMNPRRIDADELAVKALENIRNFSITQLLVVKSGKYVGIIHIHDLIREGII